MATSEDANLRRFSHPIDPRGVRYMVPKGEEWLTTREVANLVEAHPETVWRWCRKWFGELPPGRAGTLMGYRIPPEYVKVARAWLTTENAECREAARGAILADPDKHYVLVMTGKGISVAKLASTHYTVEEATKRMLDLRELHPHHRSLTLIHLRDRAPGGNQDD